jgi:hypothetical protein
MPAALIERKLGASTRPLDIRKDMPSSVERRVEFSFSSTRSVKRLDWEKWEQFDEILSHDPKHVRLERVGNGVCPLLWNHWRDDQRGVILEVTFSGDRANAIAQISRSEKGEQLLKDLEDGIISAASFGYRVYEYELVSEAEYEGDGRDRRCTKQAVYRAIDWEIFEISFCSIPADPSVGFGRSQDLDEPNAVLMPALKLESREGDSTEELTERSFDSSAFFPYGYALSLKEKYPKIWGEGGNIRGNDAFGLWQKYRIGDRTETVMKWYDTERPAWGARHYQDNRLAGVVAQIKWGVIGTLGVDGMKNVIEEEKGKKMDEELELLRSQMQELTGQIDSFRQQIEERDEQIENLKRSQTIREKYGSLRKRAESLVAEAKISTVEFRDIFADEEEKDIERLLKSNGELTNTELVNIDFYLGKSAKRSPLLNLELKTGAEPIPQRSPVPVTPHQSKYGNLSSKTIEEDAEIRAKAIEMGLNPENGNDYAKAMTAAGFTY